MTAQTATKATVPVGGDGWNLTAHIKGAFETARTVIPVADVTERGNLATKFPGSVLPNPTFISRADVGNRLETWNGSTWRVSSTLRLGKNRQAAVTTAGAAYTTICTLTATSTGGPAEVSYTGILANGNSGAVRTADVQILRDGVPVHGLTYHMPYIAGATLNVPVGFSFDTSAAAGAHTWELQTRGSAAGAIVNQEMTLTVTEQP